MAGAVLAAGCVAASAATLPAGFSESVVASGISSPTAMAFAPDGRLFVCQQGGALRVIKNGTLLSTPFLTVTTDSAGERGLLGVILMLRTTNGFTSLTRFRVRLRTTGSAG